MLEDRTRDHGINAARGKGLRQALSIRHGPVPANGGDAGLSPARPELDDGWGLQPLQPVPELRLGPRVSFELGTPGLEADEKTRGRGNRAARGARKKHSPGEGC